MEAYYHQLYNRELFDPHLISLVKRPEGQPEYDSQIPFIQINQQDRFRHLLSILQDFDVIQFQGGFNPLVCQVSKYLNNPHVLLEVLHNVEPGGLYQNIDGIIGVSNAVGSEQNQKEKYRTILNGINLDLFPFDSESKSKNKIIFLQVARRSKIAINLDQIAAEVLALDPRIELWIVGDEIGVSSERIKFFSFTENIAELYRSAHFLVLLSQFEPFGLVVIESMASGTPAIVSQSGGLLDIVNDNETGFFVEGPTLENTVAAIKLALQSLENGQYQKMAISARQDVERRFSIQDCVAQYEKYILSLYEKKMQISREMMFPPANVPADALVGEALYDFTSNEIELLAGRMRSLVAATDPISNIAVLKIAHDLSRFLKLKHPNLLPRGLSLYLFLSGDKTEYICNELLSDIEFVRMNGFFETVFRYFEQTKDSFPERWNRIQSV